MAANAQLAALAPGHRPVLGVDHTELDAWNRLTDSRARRRHLEALEARNGRSLREPISFADPDAKALVKLVFHLQRKGSAAADAARERREHARRDILAAVEPDIHRWYGRQQSHLVSRDQPGRINRCKP